MQIAYTMNDSSTRAPAPPGAKRIGPLAWQMLDHGVATGFYGFPLRGPKSLLCEYFEYLEARGTLYIGLDFELKLWGLSRGVRRKVGGA